MAMERYEGLAAAGMAISVFGISYATLAALLFALF
jgi:hypothetical protein